MRALVTGITGQDGSYLAELLLSKGYEVHGTLRRCSTVANTHRIDHIFDRLHLHHCDLTDALAVGRVVSMVQPAEVYNLAAQSHVGVSFEEPEYTSNVTAVGALRLLEAIRVHCPGARFYQASTSEMFGNEPGPQSETTPFSPRSPYAAAKLYAHNVTKIFREGYGLHASCGILFNHESPRRGETFVTRKITMAAAGIKAGKQQHLTLGNLEARRDWGHAKDYVKGMWSMLQQDEPGEYVLATGEMHSVREVCEQAFGMLGLDWTQHVEVDLRYRRPLEVDRLCGDATLASRELGWAPTVGFNELVAEMVTADTGR